MKPEKYWEKILSKVDEEAASTPQRKQESFIFYQTVEDTINFCLQKHEYKPLFDLLDYFQNQEKYPNIRHSGDTRRVNVLLYFLSFELKEKTNIFLSSVSTYHEFLTQYAQTVFALRRMELQLNEALMEEASLYVQSIPLSAYAARGIIENEYFENRKNIYWNLYQAKKKQWNIIEKTVILYQLAEQGDPLKAYLELASLCMENADYQHAYSMLCKIPTPTQDIIDLMNNLKGLLPNE